MLMNILSTGFVLGILFRNLYGNLLPTVGEVKKNTIVSLLILLVLIISSVVLIPTFGILGMGVAMTIALLVGGFLQMIFFFLYLKKLDGS